MPAFQIQASRSNIAISRTAQDSGRKEWQPTSEGIPATIFGLQFLLAVAVGSDDQFPVSSLRANRLSYFLNWPNPLSSAPLGSSVFRNPQVAFLRRFVSSGSGRKACLSGPLPAAVLPKPLRPNSAYREIWLKSPFPKRATQSLPA